MRVYTYKITLIRQIGKCNVAIGKRNGGTFDCDIDCDVDCDIDCDVFFRLL